jgi:hypothetical protein
MLFKVIFHFLVGLALLFDVLPIDVPSLLIQIVSEGFKKIIEISLSHTLQTPCGSLVTRIHREILAASLWHSMSLLAITGKSRHCEKAYRNS